MAVEFRKEVETWVSTMNWLDRQARDKGNRYFKHDMSLREGDDPDMQVAAIYYWENRQHEPMSIAIDFVREPNWGGAFKAVQEKWASKYGNNFKPIDVRLSPCANGDSIISFSYIACEGFTCRIEFKRQIINDTWQKCVEIMNESAEQENPSTFLSVTMGPVEGTDDTKRLIAIFFYNTGKDRD